MICSLSLCKCLNRLNATLCERNIHLIFEPALCHLWAANVVQRDGIGLSEDQAQCLESFPNAAVFQMQRQVPRVGISAGLKFVYLAFAYCEGQKLTLRCLYSCWLDWCKQDFFSKSWLFSSWMNHANFSMIQTLLKSIHLCWFKLCQCGVIHMY